MFVYCQCVLFIFFPLVVLVVSKLRVSPTCHALTVPLSFGKHSPTTPVYSCSGALSPESLQSSSKCKCVGQQAELQLKA